MKCLYDICVFITKKLITPRLTFIKSITICIATVIASSIVLKIPMFFQFRIVTIGDVQEYWTTSIMDSPEYLSFNFYWDELFICGVLPLTITIFCNTRIYLKVKILHGKWILIIVQLIIPIRVREISCSTVVAFSRSERRQTWELIVLSVLLLHVKNDTIHQKATWKIAVLKQLAVYRGTFWMIQITRCWDQILLSKATI